MEQLEYERRERKQRLGTLACCRPGTNDHTVPMPIRRRIAYIDYCVADIVAALNAAGIETLASCCGHGILAGNIMLADGRHLIICEKDAFDRILKK